MLCGLAILSIVRYSGPSLEWPALLAEIRDRYPDVQQMSTRDLHDRLSSPQGPGPVLIDVRKHEEYSVSHLSGALRADSLPDAMAHLGDVETDRPIVVYCSVGYRSSALARELQGRGFTRVYNLEGSIFKWANEGLPVYRNEQPVSVVHPFNRRWGTLLGDAHHAENATLTRDEPYIRSIIFLATLVVMAGLESLLPRRSPASSKTLRWGHNLGLVVFNGVLVRIIFPILPVAVGVLCARNHWGLLQLVALPESLRTAAGILLLDLGIYLQHRTFHTVWLFWKVHRMHHVDTDFDASTALRFHPIEITLSMLYKLLLVLVLGVPALGVLVFEVLLNSCALFNHGNLHIPRFIDKYLRLLIVTPDFHRVHHSAIASETNTNYGFNFPWWDRLFGSYKPQPDEGHAEMVIGLSAFREPKYLTVPWMLAVPFVRGSSRRP